VWLKKDSMAELQKHILQFTLFGLGVAHTHNTSAQNETDDCLRVIQVVFGEIQ
jgi:hypothetical protein